MFFGVLLIITWLVLLLRYPAKALPVSLAAAVGLGLVAVWVVWLDNREASQLARLELRITFAPQDCPADRPLKLTLNNGNNVPLTELRWRVAAYAPGDTVNLADNVYAAPRYRGPGELQAGATWDDCLPTPPLRSGYRPQTLEFRAEHLQGSFSDRQRTDPCPTYSSPVVPVVLAAPWPRPSNPPASTCGPAPANRKTSPTCPPPALTRCNWTSTTAPPCNTWPSSGASWMC